MAWAIRNARVRLEEQTMNDRTSWKARRPLRLLAAGALGLALATPVAAWAQADHDKSVVPAVKQSDAGSVIVHAPPRRPRRLGVPPAKAAAFAAQAANDEAWRKYRDSTPSVTDSTLDQAKAYPGLRTLVPNSP
jgi:hypothetical protein